MSTPSVVFSDRLGNTRAASHMVADSSHTGASAVSWGAILAERRGGELFGVFMVIRG